MSEMREDGGPGPDGYHPGGHGPRRGHVINLGSAAGTYPYPSGNSYGGTKVVH